MVVEGVFLNRGWRVGNLRCMLNVYLIAIRITRIKEKPRRSGGWTWYALLERVFPSIAFYRREYKTAISMGGGDRE